MIKKIKSVLIDTAWIVAVILLAIPAIIALKLAADEQRDLEAMVNNGGKM
jgi:hypothetical protein